MFQIEKYKMRTPKHKKVMQKAKSSATGKLRQKAMKNKAFKKTLLDVGGDDTREDIRDLMNESDMSLNGFVSIYLFSMSSNNGIGFKAAQIHPIIGFPPPPFYFKNIQYKTTVANIF